MDVNYLVQDLKLECCGIVDPAYFISSTKFYLLSKNYNSCLYKKISVDVDGNIKNCPSMSTSYGNISTTKLKEVLAKDEFKSIWNLNKDKIHVCSQCEYRYICTDCRAYVDDPSDILSKPLKCGYNPYTGEWKEWSKTELKDQTKKFYGMSFTS